MLAVAKGQYKHKRDLKEAVGHNLQFEETSISGPEYKSTGTFSVVGPSAYERKWFATVTMENGIIRKVE